MNKHAANQHSPAFQALIPEASKADIHLHTKASDGAPSPQELLDHVEKNTDLDVIAITDHDTMEGALAAKEIHERHDYRFDLIMGQEITSVSGHIIGLFLTKPVAKEMSAHDTVKAIHAQGGLAIAAHPLLHLKYIDPDMLTADGVGVDVLMAEQFDGIEIINGAPATKKVNARAALLNRSILFRAEIGSSDGHIPDATGKAYTLFAGKTAEDFRRAVEQKSTEAVSARYKISELLKYLKFYLKMKVREMGKRIFRVRLRRRANK